MNGQVLYFLVIFTVGIPTSDGYTGCSLSGYFDMGLMERLVQSSIVVYGRTVQHHADKVFLDGSYQYVIDAVYEVHCVLKRAEDKINERIRITGIAPRDACSGTKSTNTMKVGDYSIVSLQNTTGGLYIFHEIMPGTSAAVMALKPFLLSASKICDLQNWNPPAGAATNKCPICGIYDFPSDVKELNTAYTSPVNCIYTQNTVAINMTACDLYMEYSIDDANSRTCVPATFTQFCVRLLTRPPTATCTCDIKSEPKGLNVGKGAVMIPSVLLTLLTTFAAFVFHV